jgi:signal transduction histidine kinase/purine-cytosine permease-like protein
MIRVKREYQSWVARESLEDYALRYAARSFRRWSPFVVANTAIGGISFLALEAIGGAITISYGIQNALPAIVFMSVLIFLASGPIAYYAATAKVDIDLLTRGAGFGFIGSTVTSLIYASFTFIFFALEAAIMAQALELAFGLNIVMGYLLSSLVILPLVFFGITLISELQRWTQPIWILLFAMPMAFLLYRNPGLISDWLSYSGNQVANKGFDPLLFGAATGILFSLVVQIGEQVDYLRFLPDATKSQRRAWWTALICAGPGWIIIGGLKIAAGSLLAYAAIRAGSSTSDALIPMRMYTTAYSAVFDSPTLVTVVAALFVIISQIKINVTNAYGGSLAWSNCFARLAHYHPGRVVWLVFNVIVALILMLLGIFATLEAVLSVYSSIAIAWIGALLADLVVLKPLGVSPPYIEFKRAHLYDINPVGCGALLVGSVVSLHAYVGLLGEVARAYFAFVALGVSFVSAIFIALATKGRYYIARPDLHYRDLPADPLVQCCICEKHYEPADMAHCPFYRGPICSLCCGLENHCHDFCKDGDATGDLVAVVASPDRFMPHTGRRIGRFLGLFSLVAVVIGAVFLLTYRLLSIADIATRIDLIGAFVRLYVATLVVSAVGAWWIILSHERRELTADELWKSLHSLEDTRKELLASEKMASLGGLVAGVAHEINTPVGIAVSAASYLQDRTEEIRERWSAGRITDAELESYLNDAAESARLLLSNANRAAELVHSFKQLAGDQTPEERRRFDLRACLEDTLSSLRPKLMEHAATVRMKCPADIGMDSYPGPMAQVIANLVINSLMHGFQPGAGGLIAIHVYPVDEDAVIIRFEDDGRGLAPGVENKIFEPFFSTRKGAGSSGLGLYLVHNIVTGKLNGTICVDTQQRSGVAFIIRLPRICSPTSNVVHLLRTALRSAANE